MEQSLLNQMETEDEAGDNPAPSNVIEQNTRTIIHLRPKAVYTRGLQDWIAAFVTTLSGHMIFVYVYIVWYCVWILLRTGRLGVQQFELVLVRSHDNGRVAGSDLPGFLCTHQPQPGE